MQVDLGGATDSWPRPSSSLTACTPPSRPKIDRDLLANLLLLHASSELGLVRGLLTDEIDRGTG